jgi:hypothetical protein
VSGVSVAPPPKTSVRPASQARAATAANATSGGSPPDAPPGQIPGSPGPEPAPTCSRGVGGNTTSPVPAMLTSGWQPELPGRASAATSHAAATSRSVLPGHLPG